MSASAQFTTTPITGRIPAATAMSGLSRSAIYLLAGAGKIRLVKAGRATLVDLASVREYLQGLPEACIAAPKTGTSK